MKCDFYILNKNIKCIDSYKHQKEIVKLCECLTSADMHLKYLNIFNKKNLFMSQLKEWQIILMRVGIEPSNRNFDNLTICPLHRQKLGFSYPILISCVHPNHLKESTAKLKKRFSFEHSLFFIENQDKLEYFLKLGDGLCYVCYKNAILLIESIEPDFNDFNQLEENIPDKIDNNQSIISSGNLSK